MNQYPGFVPMMVPQHYMVAMPGIPLPPGVQPPHAHPALQQMMPPSLAVAHAGAMAPVSTTASVAQMPLPPGAQPMNVLAAVQESRKRQLPDAMLLADSRLQAFIDNRGASSHGVAAGLQWQQNSTKPDIEEPSSEESQIGLDSYNCDLNLVIDDDGYGACPLNDPPGFCFTWAGARATHGVCRGKVFYEVHITEQLPVDFGDDHNETDPHVLRVGWSIDTSSFQLGEEPWSYGYGGTGKFSTNCKFSDYGERFGYGDVIGALIDLDSKPATISYSKNGTWLGPATTIRGYPAGNKDIALFPHILSKNIRFKVNFGQLDPWFPPPQEFQYIGHLPKTEFIRGMLAPVRNCDCEMIMIVGLPGAGKTTWGLKMQKNHPEKRYNVIGTDTLIDKMRVMGLPRKRNYHGRWDKLIEKATKCLNKLFTIAAKKTRNYILDQTNVYPSARRRKMKNFSDFYRIAAVIQPDDPELERRAHKRTVEDGKYVPETAVLEMKANFTLPEDKDNLFDRIDFIELSRDDATPLVAQYKQEGQEKRPPRDVVFRHDTRFQGSDRQHQEQQQPFQGHSDMRQSPHAQHHAPATPPKPYMPNQPPPPPPPPNSDPSSQDRFYGQSQNQRNYQQSYNDHEPPTKRMKSESGSALDFIKQEYAEEDPPPAIWQEPKWDSAHYPGGQFGAEGDGFRQGQHQRQRRENFSQRGFPPQANQQRGPNSTGFNPYNPNQPPNTSGFDNKNEGGQSWSRYDDQQQSWQGRDQGSWQQTGRMGVPPPLPDNSDQHSFEYGRGQQNNSHSYGARGQEMISQQGGQRGPNSFERHGGPPPSDSFSRYGGQPGPKEPGSGDYAPSQYGQSNPIVRDLNHRPSDQKQVDSLSASNKNQSGSVSGGERPRRRKSKWDTPSSDTPQSNQPGSEDQQWPPVQVKQEAGTEDSRHQQQQQYFDMPRQQINNSSDNRKTGGQYEFNQPPPNMAVKSEQAWSRDQAGGGYDNQSDSRGSNFMSSSQLFRSNDHSGSDAQGREGPGSYNQHQHPPGMNLHGNPQRPPFQPRSHPHSGGPRFPPSSNPNHGGPHGSNFGRGGPRPFRPRNPQNFGGPQGGHWNQNQPRFGPRGPGNRLPFQPRFGHDGGHRFHRPPGPQRFNRPR